MVCFTQCAQWSSSMGVAQCVLCKIKHWKDFKIDTCMNWSISFFISMSIYCMFIPCTQLLPASHSVRRHHTSRSSTWWCKHRLRWLSILLNKQNRDTLQYVKHFSRFCTAQDCIIRCGIWSGTQRLLMRHSEHERVEVTLKKQRWETKDWILKSREWAPCQGKSDSTAALFGSVFPLV